MCHFRLGYEENIFLLNFLNYSIFYKLEIEFYEKRNIGIISLVKQYIKIST